MKLLLDENLPIRLKYRFESSISVGTVTDEGWSSLKDRELLETINDLLSPKGSFPEKLRLFLKPCVNKTILGN